MLTFTGTVLGLTPNPTQADPKSDLRNCDIFMDPFYGHSHRDAPAQPQQAQA